MGEREMKRKGQAGLNKSVGGERWKGEEENGRT